MDHTLSAYCRASGNFGRVAKVCECCPGKDSLQLLTALVQLPSLQHIFPNLHKLAVIALVNKMSRADCEGGFSALKRMKTRLQNRFSNRILSNLLIISIEGPEVNKMDHSIGLSYMLCSSCEKEYSVALQLNVISL